MYFKDWKKIVCQVFSIVCISVLLINRTSSLMDVKISSNRIKLNEEFQNISEFEECLSLYEEEKQQVFYIADSHLLESKQPAGPPPNYECKYLNCKLVCLYGESRHKARGIGARETKTVKNGCGVFIYIVLTLDNQKIKIQSLNLEHNGHEGSEAFYYLLPKNRKLKSKNDIEEVKKLMQAGCKISGIQNVLMSQGKHVLPKDLHNFKQRHVKDPCDDELQTAIDLLKNVYKAKINVVYEKTAAEKRLKALYFSTEEMRSRLKSYPEIVFIDGTYKLLKRGYITLLMCVQDALGLTHIVAVALLENEQKVTLEEVFTIFKNKNPEAAERIRCFMTDKDLTERAVLKKVFPHAVLCICEFHVLKIFSRTVTIAGMQITAAERDEALIILDKLIKSDSEEQYKYWYQKFREKVPSSVVQYFDTNWEPNRNEWVRYAMSEHNLGNYTNNPVESTNARLKDGIPANSSLKDFINGFFNYYRRRKMAIDNHVHADTYKKPKRPYPKNSVEYRYQNVLTGNAFNFVIQQFKRKEPMSFLHVHKNNKICLIRSGFRIVTATINECDCNDYKEKKLPCRHIFAVRSEFGLDLYAADLCPEKCTKQYNLANHQLLEASQKAQDSKKIQSTSFHDRNTDLVSPIECSRIKTPKPKNRQQRFKTMKEITDRLADIGSMAVGEKFERRRRDAEMLLESWTNDDDLCIDKDLADLSLSEPVDLSAEDKVVQASELVCSTPLKVKGRPKDIFKSTIRSTRKR